MLQFAVAGSQMTVTQVQLKGLTKVTHLRKKKQNRVEIRTQTFSLPSVVDSVNGVVPEGGLRVSTPVYVHCVYVYICLYVHTARPFTLSSVG